MVDPLVDPKWSWCCNLLIYWILGVRKMLQVPSSAQLKMKMTQISSGSFFILEPADEFLETQWFQGLACRLGRLAACRPLDDARPIFRKSFRGLREIQEKSSDECLHSRRTLFCIYKQDEVLR